MNDVLSILKSTGAIVSNSHFVYTSGRHGDTYVRKDLLYTDTQKTSAVCLLFAQKYKDVDIDIVVGPSIGAIILAQWTAFHLSQLKKKNILCLFTEKDENSNQIFKRGYDKIAKEKNILIVEDLTTTGGSVKKVADEVAKYFGKKVRIIPSKLAEGSTPRRCPDITKIKKLGFSPEIAFPKGVRLTTAWYDQNST